MNTLNPPDTANVMQDLGAPKDALEAWDMIKPYLAEFKRLILSAPIGGDEQRRLSMFVTTFFLGLSVSFYKVDPEFAGKSNPEIAQLICAHIAQKVDQMIKAKTN